MPERDLPDPLSLLGASPDEVLALVPPGWLVRPIPGSDSGFRILSPGKMPGSQGKLTYNAAGSPGRAELPPETEPWLFVLNAAVEQPLLTEILEEWGPPPAAARLAEATGNLVRERLIQVYLDPLSTDELLLLDSARARREVADIRNWWRDEDDPDTEPARYILSVTITGKGRKRLAEAARPRPPRSRLPFPRPLTRRRR